MVNPGFHAGYYDQTRDHRCRISAYGGMFITEELVAKEDIYPYMDGPAVFKKAVIKLPEVIMEALDKNNLKTSDINMLIPHQANLRISQYIQQKMSLRDDQVHNNIQKFGNTTAASVPIALCEAWEEGKNKRWRSGLPGGIRQRIYLGKCLVEMVIK